MRRLALKLATVLGFGLAAVTAQAQSDEELRLVKETLHELQLLSFENNVEYCGYFVLDENDNMIATKATKGEESSCLADDYPESYFPFASYHTHGAANDEGSFEMPSYNDVEGDEEEGIDGYVSTPGGRLWYVDTQDNIVALICDLKCLPQDENFFEYDDEIPEVSYTFEELRKLELEE